MATWMRILCAVDFSESSRDAVRLAARLARWTGATLTLAHVREPERGGALHQPTREEAERELAIVRGELDGWRAEAAAARGGDVAAVVATGAPADELVRLAREERCDAIVTGTRARSGLGRLVLGSVAARVVRGAPCSVLVAPPGGAAADGRRILCAIDFSEASRAALEQAADLARASGAELALLHVFTPPRATLLASDLLAYTPHELEEEAAAELRSRLAAWEAAAAARVHASVSSEVRPGEPVAELAREVAARRAGLVVVGTHGRTGLRRLVLGSVAERVVAESEVPVLVARARDDAALRPVADEEWQPAGRHDDAQAPPFH